MSHTFHQLYYHFIWATHSREPFISREWRPELLNIINDEVNLRGGIPLRHNAMPDHVHLVARLPPTVLISDFVGKVKGATSFRVNRQIKPRFKLQWQEGYGVLSLRRDDLEKVYHYVDNQEEHHRSRKISSLLETIDADDDWPEGDSLKPAEAG
jgi:putative transposase